MFHFDPEFYAGQPMHGVHPILTDFDAFRLACAPDTKARRSSAGDRKSEDVATVKPYLINCSLFWM